MHSRYGGLAVQYSEQVTGSRGAEFLEIHVVRLSQHRRADHDRPLLYALYASLQRPQDYGHLVGPAGLTLSNYSFVFHHAPIGRWYLNTIIVTGGVIIGSAVLNTMAGYALARLRFPGRSLSFLIVLVVLMVPLQAILVPLYLSSPSWDG